MVMIRRDAVAPPFLRPRTCPSLQHQPSSPCSPFRFCRRVDGQHPRRAQVRHGARHGLQVPHVPPHWLVAIMAVVPCGGGRQCLRSRLSMHDVAGSASASLRGAAHSCVPLTHSHPPLVRIALLTHACTRSSATILQPTAITTASSSFCSTGCTIRSPTRWTR